MTRWVIFSRFHPRFVIHSAQSPAFLWIENGVIVLGGCPKMCSPGLHDPLLLLTLNRLLPCLVSNSTFCFSCPSPMTEEFELHRPGTGGIKKKMLRALFLSLDECNLCVCWQWDSPATVSKLVVVRENGSALTISVPHTHSLSLFFSLETLDLFRSSALCRLVGSSSFFATISCHKSRTDAMLKVGTKQISPSSSSFFFL